MQALKYSRQRECIKNYLSTSKEHPTADMVYSHIKMHYPKVSLGTVYRNLALLTELGEVIKINTGDGADRFDGNPNPHYHFICNNCRNVLDIPMKHIEGLCEAAQEHFSGEIQGSVTQFYGICEECKKNEK